MTERQSAHNHQFFNLPHCLQLFFIILLSFAEKPFHLCHPIIGYITRWMFNCHFAVSIERNRIHINQYKCSILSYVETHVKMRDLTGCLAQYNNMQHPIRNNIGYPSKRRNDRETKSHLSQQPCVSNDCVISISWSFVPNRVPMTIRT